MDDFQNALKEITFIMIDAYNKHKLNKKLETQKQANKQMLKYLQTRQKQLYNEIQ